jgi:gas vesicle protein
MGTFLLGGIVGAVAVVYFNRNSGMMMSNISQAGQTVGNLVNKARNSISNMDMGMMSSNKAMNSTTNGASTGTSGMNTAPSGSNANYGISTTSAMESDLSKVEAIVNKDPDLKNKVDEILKENKQTISAHGLQ